MFVREVSDSGSARLTSDRCTFEFTRLRPGVLLVKIAGEDLGQFGSAAVDEIAAEFARFSRPLTLLVDAAAALAPANRVMQDWTAWFKANRQKLERVVVLVHPESRLTLLTVSIARHLSHTGDLIHISTDADAFEAQVARESAGPSTVRKH